MSQPGFESSKANGAHYRLHQLAGEWEGVSRVFFDESGTPQDESPTRGTIRPILGGRFMLHEYKGSYGDKPLEGLALYGCDLATAQFQCAWIDSFHMSTGILFSQEKTSDKLFDVLGSYAAGPERWGWRTEISLPNENTLIIKATNLTPGGEAAGGVETILQRVQ